MTPATRKSALFTSALSQARYDSIQPVMAEILARAKGREFTTGDAATWVRRHRDGVIYPLSVMLDAGLIITTGQAGRQKFYREVRA